MDGKNRATRTSDGRFLPGHPGGPGRKPGNTIKKRVELRAAILNDCSVGKILEYFRDIEEIARCSNDNKDRLQAYKLILSYLLGAPTQEIAISEDVDEDVQRARAEIAAKIHPIGKDG